MLLADNHERQTLYNGGDAKKFVVVSVGAQGCHSVTLALFPNMPRDSRGCVKPIDDISWNSGQQTLAMLENLHQLHPDANYNFVDLYSATHYIIDHRDEFGNHALPSIHFKHMLFIIVMYNR